MTELERQKPWIVAKAEADPVFARERAAAALAVRAASLLREAWAQSEAQGMTRQQLADRLGVHPSRVTQVLNGDGNVHLATLSKFLRELGFGINLETEVIDPTRRPIGLKRRRRQAPEASHGTSRVYHALVESQGRRSSQYTILDANLSIEGVLEVSPQRLIGTLRHDHEAIQLDEVVAPTRPWKILK